MASERTQRIALGVLVVALVAVGAYEFRPAPAAAPSTASNAGGRRTRAEAPATPTAPDVHIAALSSERPKPDDASRDLFKFKPKAPPPRPAAPQPQRPAVSQPVTPPRPSGPPPPPPITLKFIGYIQAPDGRKIASLSDGRGPISAKEGDIVLGQYKIWRIGVESLDISYLDGRGRQTIRMTGQ